MPTDWTKPADAIIDQAEREHAEARQITEEIEATEEPAEIANQTVRDLRADNREHSRFDKLGMRETWLHNHMLPRPELVGG